MRRLINVCPEIIVAGQVARDGGCHFRVTAQPPYTAHEAQGGGQFGDWVREASTMLQPCFPSTFADGASVGSPPIGSNPDATSAKNPRRRDSSDKPLMMEFSLLIFPHSP